MSTLRTSLGLALSILALAACGGDDSPYVPPAPPSPTAPPPPPPGPTPARTQVTGTLLPTTTKNLLLDPGFFLTEQGGQIAGAFLAVYEQGQGNLTLRVRVDSTSPAGFAGGVAIAKEPKATDEKARSIQFLAAFTGGKGPFVAKVWVASVDAAGAPRAFPEDGGGFEASILDPGRQSQAAELQRDDTAPRVSGGRTWVRYSGQLPRDLVGGGMMIMTTGTKGGGFELAAPEIVATSATTALSRVPVMRVRPMRESERAAVLAYDRIPKRLEAAPAGERAKRPSLTVPFSH